MDIPEELKKYHHLYAYMVSRQLAKNDPPFSSFIICAMRKADSNNLHKLIQAFPDIWRELSELYNLHVPELE